MILILLTLIRFLSSQLLFFNLLVFNLAKKIVILALYILPSSLNEVFAPSLAHCNWTSSDIQSLFARLMESRNHDVCFSLKKMLARLMCLNRTAQSITIWKSWINPFCRLEGFYIKYIIDLLSTMLISMLIFILIF